MHPETKPKVDAYVTLYTDVHVPPFRWRPK